MQNKKGHESLGATIIFYRPGRKAKGKAAERERKNMAAQVVGVFLLMVSFQKIKFFKKNCDSLRF